MTLREIELEVWQEFGRRNGMAPEEVASALHRARMADEIMDEVVPEEQVAVVRRQLVEVIRTQAYLFTRQN